MPAQLVQIQIWFLLIDHVASGKDGAGDRSGPPNERRRGPCSTSILLEYLLPTIQARAGDNQTAHDLVFLPAKIPQSQSSILQVATDFTVNHSRIARKGVGMRIGCEKERVRFNCELARLSAKAEAKRRVVWRCADTQNIQIGTNLFWERARKKKLLSVNLFRNSCKLRSSRPSCRFVLVPESASL